MSNEITPVAVATRGVNINGLADELVRVSSVESINKYLIRCGLPEVTDTKIGAVQLARASGAKSQSDVAVLVVNLTNGSIQADELTKVLHAAFPSSKVGPRHGPHYLSLARTGKLKGVEVQGIAHTKRGKKTKIVPVVVTSAAAAETTAPSTQTSEAGAEHVALLEAVGVDVQDAVHEAAEHDALTTVLTVDSLRTELEALSQKDLAARAKAVGVKPIGKKESIIAGIIAAS